MSHLRSLLLAAPVLLIAACGSEPSPAGGNVASQVVRYRLIPAQGSFDPAGSRIAFVTRELGVPPAPPSPLEGSFDVVPVLPNPANSRVALNIIRLRFTGGSYVINGHAGYIEITTLDVLRPLRVSAAVAINGTSIDLAGVGDPGTFSISMDSPPQFSGVDLASGADSLGSYYHLTLFAEPSA